MNAALTAILRWSHVLRSHTASFLAEIRNQSHEWKFRLRSDNKVSPVVSEETHSENPCASTSRLVVATKVESTDESPPQGVNPEPTAAASRLPRDKIREEIRSRLSSMYEVSNNSARSIPMEGVRGLAVLLVFFVHFDGMFISYLVPHSALFELSKFWWLVGNTGVDLFFVLSGYLIYGALLRKRVPYLKFIKRRAERIYPTFLCVLVLYLAVSTIEPRLSKIHAPFLSGAGLIAANALLLPGIFQITAIVTVAWSLSYEFFFYLTIPLIVYFTGMADWKRRSRVAFFASIGLGYLVYSFTVPTSHVRLLMFLSGIMLYEVISSGVCKAILQKRVGEVVAATIFVMSLVLVYALDTDKWLTFLPRTGNTVLPGVVSYEGPYKVIALTLSCFPFVLFCIEGRGFLARLFSWTPARYLGNMSYSFYLIHGATLNAFLLLIHRVFKPDGNSPVLFCSLLPVAFALSWLSSTVLFAFVEKPISLGVRSVPVRVVIRESKGQEEGNLRAE